MKLQSKHLLTSLSLWAVMAVASAHAAMVSNLGNTPTTYYPAGNDGTDEFQVAGSFTTGTQATVLQSVDVRLNGTLSGTEDLSVSIWSDSGSLPSASLVALTPSGDSTPDASDTVYNYTGTLPLLASTTYWLVLTVPLPNPDGYYWFVTDDTSEVSDAGWTIGNGYASGLNNVWSPVADVIPEFSVTAVPEPASLVLCGTSAAGFIAFARRRRALRQKHTA